VFLQYTKFQMDTLVVCGFLVGAHPGHLRRDEAEEELHGSRGLDFVDLKFQLSSRSISVPIKEGNAGRFGLQAVVIESSTRDAPNFRECFYKLKNPAKAIESYPYTGMYQLVPFLKSKEWPIEFFFSAC
jgi:hypothetical protein